MMLEHQLVTMTRSIGDWQSKLELVPPWSKWLSCQRSMFRGMHYSVNTHCWRLLLLFDTCR